MARPLRLESEAGVYHLLNRGNHRADIFRSEGAKKAFLKCLGEACTKTGWIVHAWCLMRNHYHLAVSTPGANLVDGMQWLQGTFATRFNRMRKEHGHLFQGRYKSLLVDPDGGLGPLSHYIHLNPVRARVCAAAGLPECRWTSLFWLMNPKARPACYDPRPALAHAGGLADTAAGRRKYLAYLGWLSEDDNERRKQRFDEMSKGWIIGTKAFAKEMMKENRELLGQGKRMAAATREAREALWLEERDRLLRKLRRKPEEVGTDRKTAPWKAAIAAAMKERTTATNRWLAGALNMGGLHEVSRYVSAWNREPDAEIRSKLWPTTHSKA
jgi:putative transposase